MADERRGDPERPDYKVYRSRRGLFSRLRSPDLSNLRERMGRKGSEGGRREERPPRVATTKPLWRRVLRWVGIFALGWILLSLILFAISAQIQKGKLANLGDTLHGNPCLSVSPQTILVMGTDIRSGQFAGANEAESKKCLEVVQGGKATAPSCQHGPYRSDTLMLVRAGRGAFRRLSIPRDTLAEIPGLGAEKINSAYANGGAKLTVRTIENFLGINVDQVAIVDFDGFRKFIDTIGGINVNLPDDVCSTVSDGAFKLDLKEGEHTLNGFQAITLARTRENTCGTSEFRGTDLERAQFQQLILDGIRNRLTDPLRLPYNLVKGPFIAWGAPQVMVSSMGAWTMPQLVFAAGIGFSNGSDVLKPNGETEAGNLIIPSEECLRAVKKFLGSGPPHQPACSPPG